jgi:uncharacterized protein (DUF427 family)
MTKALEDQHMTVVARPPSGAVVRVEPTIKRVRAMLGGETVVDSRRTLILFEEGHLPVYYFPREDVREDLLEPTDHHTTCPRKGVAGYWTVRAGERVAENAVWGYPEPIDSCADISGHVAFYWNKMDSWWEEDDQVFVHARDPYHRVDVLRSSRHVRVELDGEVVAETRRSLLLLETGLPPRWYIPAPTSAGSCCGRPPSRRGARTRGRRATSRPASATASSPTSPGAMRRRSPSARRSSRRSASSTSGSISSSTASARRVRPRPGRSRRRARQQLRPMQL